jgi:hypothetical protein
VQRDIWIGERSRVLQIEKSKWVSCGAPPRIDFGRCSGVSTGRRYGAYSQGFDEPMVQSGGSGVDGPVVQTGGSRVDVWRRLGPAASVVQGRRDAVTARSRGDAAW